MNEQQVVSFKGLRELGIQYSRTHIDRLERTQKVPRSFKLDPSRGGRRVWWLSEWIVWLKSKAK